MPSAKLLATPSSAVSSTGEMAAAATNEPQASVKVTAVNGNIFIHRGPDLAFNPIAVLIKGQTVVATARDVLAKWVQVQLPGDPKNTGWITILTDYTQVLGDVASLPEVSPTEWPDLAFLRNCTHDLMEADPGGVTVPPVDYFPDNEVRINPGTYHIHDLDVDKYPEVLVVDIREGSAIDIRVDGTGEKKKCPPP
jgi:hypothetical protein